MRDCDNSSRPRDKVREGTGCGQFDNLKFLQYEEEKQFAAADTLIRVICSASFCIDIGLEHFLCFFD